MEPAKKLAAERKNLFIGGRWVEPSTGGYFSTINPATEEPIGQISLVPGGDRTLNCSAQLRKCR